MLDSNVVGIDRGREILDEAAARKSDNPINLFRGLAAHPLTREDVPRVIGEYSDYFARAGGFDTTGAIVAGVVACATAIDDGLRLRLPGASGHFQSARLWAAAIGSPGSGKSPMQKEMLAPIYELHRALVEDNIRAQREATDDEQRTQIPHRAIFTSDCTVDKLSELLSDNPRGLLYAVDEFDSWLGQHDAFGRDGGSRNRGEWMRLYDGGPHQVDRVRRGSFFVKNWGASVLTATTPAALTRLARKLSADGLFQRFLVFSIRPMQERDPTIAMTLVEHSRREYKVRIAEVFNHTASLFEKPIVHLSPEATSLYEEEDKRLRVLVDAAGSIGEGFAAHIAKHPGMLGRVALTFHAVSDELVRDDGTLAHPCTVKVSGESMQLAIRFMRRAYQHAYAIYTDCLGTGSPMDLTKAVARSLLADRFVSFNRREITFKCKAFRAASEWQRQAALTNLEDFGWVEGDAMANAHAHGGRWKVNPHVHELFATEATAALARRIQVRERLSIEPM